MEIYAFWRDKGYCLLRSLCSQPAPPENKILQKGALIFVRE